jgi:hypothetical protein
MGTGACRGDLFGTAALPCSRKILMRLNHRPILGVMVFISDFYISANGVHHRGATAGMVRGTSIRAINSEVS